MVTKVVNIKTEECDIYIGRGPSKWGNPFTHIKDKTTLAKFVVDSREEALSKYREYILTTPDLYNALHELDGKVLGCWCLDVGSFPVPFKCHGQVLVELRNQQKLTQILK